MIQSRPRFATFEDYLAYEGLEGRYELIEGDLVELPPESEWNLSIANYLYFLLVAQNFSARLVHPGKCELQVPVLQPKDPANRFPDLVILREEHLPLTQRRLTITLDMPPPQLVVEVVSPGQANRERDYHRKRDQYAMRGIPEYWIINPEEQVVMVLQLRNDRYVEVGIFQGTTPITSSTFPNLALTADQIFRIA
ncbi:Uma2 family endonuclease [Leptolyngbya sp. 7M]|uniref:Uma2 family endonuclease n=1 Tax=Leptolyngbya sp. 7M TaxID=2812896 RepID=UPI001B8D385C|nr:Uma2 family endonuclease [Leptolyngbya sp. 7M]QYO67380.1 Uma2 family endonuclease [Leptolyngbya sp. 7M]